MEKEMILKCLDDTRVALLGPTIVALARAVKADAVDDVRRARKAYEALDRMDLGEYDLLWKKKMEYLFAVDEDKALAGILHGRRWFPAPVIVFLLEALRAYTKDEERRLRYTIHLLEYSSNYSYKVIARQYEDTGDESMAREYHELAGATGDKESQEWMIGYLERLAKQSWLREEFHRKQLESWKKMIGEEKSKTEI